MRQIFQTIRDCIVSPKEFVKKHKKPEAPKQLVIFLVAITIIGFLLNVVSVIVIQPVFNQIYSQISQTAIEAPQYNPGLIVPSLIQSIIGAMISAAIVTTILHFWLKLFSKKGTWKELFKVYVYAQTPIAVFGWLPLLSIVGLVYSLYLLILGVQQTHDLDRRTAVLVIVIPTIILFVVSILLSIIAFSALSTLPQE